MITVLYIKLSGSIPACQLSLVYTNTPIRVNLNFSKIISVKGLARLNIFYDVAYGIFEDPLCAH